MSEAKSFVVKQSEIEKRFDPFYYLDEYREIEKKLEKLANVVTIEDISSKITDGTHEKTSYVKEGVPLLRVQNVSEDGVTLDDVVFITKEEHEKRLKRTILEPGDVLLTKDGRVGTSTVFTGDIREANLSAHVARIVLKSDVNSYYISTFLNTRVGQLQIERKTKGVCSRGISLPLIGSIKIPLPSREIQDKIATIIQEAYKQRKEKLKEAMDVLNNIDDYVLEKLGIDILEVEERRSFIVKSDELNERYDPSFHKPFLKRQADAILKCKYECKSMKDIGITVYRRFRPEPGRTYKYIELGDIDRLAGEIREFREISLPHIPSRAQQIVQRRDVLIAISEPKMSAFAVVENEQDGWVCSSGFAVFKSSPESNPIYIHSFLRTKTCLSQMDKYTTGAGLFQAISKADLLKIKIPIPPIKVQNEIAIGTQRRKQRAEQLKREAEEIVKEAKEKVEKMILGN